MAGAVTVRCDSSWRAEEVAWPVLSLPRGGSKRRCPGRSSFSETTAVAPAASSRPSCLRSRRTGYAAWLPAPAPGRGWEPPGGRHGMGRGQGDTKRATKQDLVGGGRIRPSTWVCCPSGAMVPRAKNSYATVFPCCPPPDPTLLRLVDNSDEELIPDAPGHLP
ncbi:uncharacterized protein LOC105070226 isoform X1 [Camelus bactrianus]|uniref:Uncharacterized protein LOC105070226 isoform X1 n=1 Tax=Camelus bactrianus TaxID=9837 RepID=A0AC58Q2J1_CAMBA